MSCYPQYPRSRVLQSGMVTASRLFVIFLLFASFLFPKAILALDPQKTVFQYNILSWNRQSGLPGDRINTITQTPDGYIWIGTQHGLVRFDGVRFSRFSDGFPFQREPDVRQLHVGPSGQLWVTINFGLLGRMQDLTFEAIEEPLLLSVPWITGKGILEAMDGSVWLGTNHLVVRHLPEAPGEGLVNLEAIRMTVFAEDPQNGRIWIGTESEGLYYYEEGEIHRLQDPGLSDLIIFALAVDHNGHLWVGSQRELLRFDQKGQRLPAPASPGPVSSLLVDKNGLLWVGTEGAGLARLEGDDFSVLTQFDGLPSNRIYSLFQDREGSIWAGTADGLSQISDLKFPTITDRDGLIPGVIHTVAPSIKGGIWVSGNLGAGRYYAGQLVEHYGAETFINDYIKIGYETSDGTVYFIDGDRAINVMVDGEVQERHISRRWPEAITELNGGGVALGLGNSLYVLRDGELSPYPFAAEDTPNFSYFHNLITAKDGSLWAATYNGIFRIQGRAWRQWTRAQGLPGERIHYLMEDSDGLIWAGTPDGIIRLKNNRASHITQADGLLDDRIFAIVEDDFGYFWIDSANGIFRVSKDELNAFADGSTEAVTVTEFSGLASVRQADRIDQQFSACRTPDGRIWFPSSRGVIMVNPADYFVNPVPPPVHIQEIRINGATLTNWRQPDFIKGSNRIEFQFAALSFIAPRQIRIEYRLEGLDTEWVSAENSRNAHFNLKPGSYRFEVRAANADGVWSEKSASYAFVIPPPYYGTYWFWSLVMLMAGLIAFGAYRWKTGQIRMREQVLREANDLLEAKVEERTEAVIHSLSFIQATLESTADGILAVRFSGEITNYNKHFLDMWELSEDQIKSMSDEDIIQYCSAMVKDSEAYIQRVREIHLSEDKEAFDLLHLKDGRIIERHCKPQKVEGRIVGIVINTRDITARKEAEAELARANAQLLDSSRQAGMAEVATSVLHNVGNVLNSVNVASSVVAEKITQSRALNIGKVADMLREHSGNLPHFLTEDPRGKQIPQYLTDLAGHLSAENKELISELENLRKNIEHIKDIVAMQQSYAKISGVMETVPIQDLVEDAIRMNAGAFVRHDIQLTRDYRDNPSLTVEKHHVLQILINVLRNAKYACDEGEKPSKEITIRIHEEDECVRIAVIDNGIGIPPENLQRIFNHGFTTRAAGHGFGLHSGALAAKAMGGRLIAESDGHGLGATFTLEIPLQTVAPEIPSGT